jgi:hypothetical protein
MSRRTETSRENHGSSRRALSVKTVLEQLRQNDEEKHRLLSGFFVSLQGRRVLPDSQDLHHFAHLIGCKSIAGKSRREMVSRLMHFLVRQPADRLEIDLKRAEGISQEQRRKGFSVLTDKLMGNYE